MTQYFCFIWALLFAVQGFCEEHPSKTGTLIVSYQTGLQGERLDRIRFLLTDQQLRQHMYPKKGCYVEDVSCLTRMVIVEDLPVGEYLLEFIVPNADNLFEELPTRTIQIEDGQVAKIDQVIQVKYATLQAKISIPDLPMPLKAFPSITLKTDTQVRAQSQSGVLNVSNLLPGEYSVIFGPLPGFQTPSPVHVKLSPDQVVGPFVGIYLKPSLPATP